jgi:hypothetical protein
LWHETNGAIAVGATNSCNAAQGVFRVIAAESGQTQFAQITNEYGRVCGTDGCNITRTYEIAIKGWATDIGEILIYASLGGEGATVLGCQQVQSEVKSDGRISRVTLYVIPLYAKQIGNAVLTDIGAARLG